MKVNNYLLLLCSLIIFSCSEGVYKKKNSFEGPVKQIINSSRRVGSNYVQTDDTTRFNKRGNEVYHYSSAMNYFSWAEDHYNEKGILESIDIRDFNGHETYYHTLHHEYDNNGNIERIIVSNKDSVIRTQEHVYSDNYSKRTIITKWSDGDTDEIIEQVDSAGNLVYYSRLNHEYKYFYNGDTLYKEVSKYNNNSKILTYKYLKFDSLSNWTHRLIYIDGKKHKHEYRDIAYY